MINAIILAAGESKRMGKLKPLLRFKDKTFLEQIISELKLSDVDRITVVLGAKAETVIKSVDLSGISTVINKEYLIGQLSSLIAGLKDVPGDTEAILICLVDNPFITKEIVNSIISKFKKTGEKIIIPVFNKKKGHPALFAESLFNELLSAPAEQGARYVVHANKKNILELETTEKGILIGINTPEDYRDYFKTNP